jgi:NYN domain
VRSECPVCRYLRTVNGVSTALYIDFDNVFSGLVDLDPVAAVSFAEHPARWLSRLSAEQPVEGPRRWTVLRCYLNAAGSARHPDPDRPRIPFAPFRSAFVRAGFEVVDCPSLTPQGKNAADIRLTVDVLDALHAPTRYDEFVIASADSDFSPLLVRLRAADRRTTLLSTYQPRDALTSVADRHVDGGRLLDLVSGTRPRPAPAGVSVPGTPVTRAPKAGAEARFASTMRRIYASADAPLALGALGQTLSSDLGPAIKASRWFGRGTLTKAVDGLGLPNAQLSRHHLWDSTRHRAPSHAG